MSPTLFDNVKVGRYSLKNRVVMAPMTRARSTYGDDLASDLMLTYYSQRASAGLIVTEATQTSQLGKAYAVTPGIYTAAQVASWKKVTDAVHKEGGKIFLQIVHSGRISHEANTGGVQPISASAIAAKDVKVLIINDKGEPAFVDAATPRAMTHDDIKTVVGEFKQAAHNALDAGFDGVELHAANGYLINQFIDSESNERTDEYGGSIENRMKFLGQCVDELVSVLGAGRVGVRLSPYGSFNGAADRHPAVTYLHAAKYLSGKKIAYLHIAVQEGFGGEAPQDFRTAVREAFKGAIVYTGMYDLKKGTAAVVAGYADCIGFGQLYISNPDLVERMQKGYPLAEADQATYYQGGAEGFTSYSRHRPADSSSSSKGFLCFC